MSILKLAPAAVIREGQAEAIRKLIACDAPIAADSRYLFSMDPQSGSIVVNGNEAGESFAQYLDEKGFEALGTDAEKYETLPVVIRDLGVENGELFYSPAKKNQAFWYITDAKAGSVIYFGLKDALSKDELEKALEDGSYKDKLQAVDIQKDDLLVVDPGTIYVFEKGPSILEIERNVPDKDDNYKAAIEDINVGHNKHDYHKGDWVADGQAEHIDAGRNDVFELDLYQLDGRMDMDTDDKTFKTLVFLEGTAVIDDHHETIHAEKDTVLFVPAYTEPFHITGNAKFALVHLVQ